MPWPPDRRTRYCSAHKQNGDPCRQQAIRGARVCKMHGGSAPQVKLAARERLEAMVDPLLSELFRIAMSGDSDAVRLAAIRDALDRAGYKPTEKVEQMGGQTIRVDYSRANQPPFILTRKLPGNGHDHADDP